ncbi:hypothetical protein [Bacteroides thetaiotaomicron]|uniref:hypothetical protein n=1 Tax=Bacteroides thetaiotaomicron TaxID=818 RepID=UPI002165C5DD|nr:hypothetical protein [Bacteroides thetaiotaomicron]
MLKVTHIIITQNTERTSQFKVVDTWEQRFEEVFTRKDITQRYRRGRTPNDYLLQISSASLGWVASEEDFSKNSFLRVLQLRASFGILGSD